MGPNNSAILAAALRKEQCALVTDMLHALADGTPLPGILGPADGLPSGNFTMLPFETEAYEYCVAGDIHGDLGAFVLAARVAQDLCPEGKAPVLVILGDLIDRGERSLECVLYLFRLALGRDPEHPAMKVLFIRGDHDEALSYDEATCDVRACVQPSEVADSMATPEARYSADGAVVHAFARFVVKCPAAVYFTNGILLAHGGVPHSDLQPSIHDLADLQSDACAQDFAWCRLHPTARRKRPNRHSRTCELGIENFREFAETFGNILWKFRPELPGLLGFLHGHDHVAGGFANNVPYGAVCTVNTFHATPAYCAEIRPNVVHLLPEGFTHYDLLSLVSPIHAL